MRFIIDYIRSLFCKHDYIMTEAYCEDKYEPLFSSRQRSHTGIKVSCVCKKCAYHKSFWKY